mgnify:CR=1 FL=1
MSENKEIQIGMIVRTVKGNYEGKVAEILPEKDIQNLSFEVIGKVPVRALVELTSGSFAGEHICFPICDLVAA